MYVATERETSDNTEATRFSQCAHDQRRRLEAEDCNSIRCAQLISGGRRRIRPCPPHCLAHARPTMCCIRLVYTRRARIAQLHDAVVHAHAHPAPPGAGRTMIIGASLSEPHTSGTSAARVCYMYRTYVKEVPGVQIRHVWRRGADRGYGCRHARRRSAGRPIALCMHGTNCT